MPRGTSTPNERLADFLAPESEPADFWQDVKTNLEAGRIRLIFVADKIPLGLRRIVEFLNGQMNPAEVLAIEIRQHVGSGPDSPRTDADRSNAQPQRGPSPSGATIGRQWDEPTFFADLQAKKPDAVPVARKILDWCKSNRAENRLGDRQTIRLLYPGL